MRMPRLSLRCRPLTADLLPCRTLQFSASVRPTQPLAMSSSFAVLFRFVPHIRHGLLG